MTTPGGRRNRAPRAQGKLIGLVGIAAVIAAGGVALYMSGPQTGPYRLQTVSPEAAATQAEPQGAVPKALSFLIEIPERGGLEIAVKGGGETALTISEVRLDGSPTGFAQQPPGAIAPGASARISVEHTLAIGEVRDVALVTTTGEVFSRQMGRIDSALYTTRFGADTATAPPAR